MQLWLSFIKSENDYLVINPHFVPSFPEIKEEINKALLYTLYSQLQINENQLLNFDNVDDAIDSLERAEVVYRGNGKNYYINQYLLPWLENWLETKNLLK
jgi:hypothetical protein